MYSKTSFHRHVRGVLPEFRENPNDSSNVKFYLRPNNSRHTSKWVGPFFCANETRVARKEDFEHGQYSMNILFETHV